MGGAGALRWEKGQLDFLLGMEKGPLKLRGPGKSLSFLMGDMGITKGSCQERGKSALLMLLPSLRVGNCGGQGQVRRLPFWASLSPLPFVPSPAL